MLHNVSTQSSKDEETRRLTGKDELFWMSQNVHWRQVSLGQSLGCHLLVVTYNVPRRQLDHVLLRWHGADIVILHILQRRVTP
jgi:hypothetical protein